MTRSDLERLAASYRRSEERRQESREKLREGVLKARETMPLTEIADALGWSRKAVYDLIGKP